VGARQHARASAPAGCERALLLQRTQLRRRVELCYLRRHGAANTPRSTNEKISDRNNKSKNHDATRI
jgi:hypothetical protein